MIPVKLKLSNFTSYGDNVPELDLTKFHMAAISGQNGAGKSSLLDSITWCVWGTSRLGDSSDQLVRLGQTQMLVEFSFELDGHIYTVKRGRSLKGGGSTSLELLSNSHNLTEGTIKATQQKIIDTLHLSYETFTNSAFLRQGHADEFTTKGPSDRKRILADILGLSHYDKLEEKAKEKTKELQTKLQLLEYQLLEIEAELSQKDAREKALTEAEEEAKKIEAQLKEIEQVIKTIELERENLNLKMKSLEEAKVRVEAAQKELADLKNQIALKEEAQAEHQNILAQRAQIEENYQKLQSYQQKRQALESKRTELITVKDELNALQKVFMERDSKKNKAISDLEVEKKRLQTQNQQLEEQNKQLLDNKAFCPTCGQTIGKEKNEEIISKNSQEIAQNNTQFQEVEAKIKKYQDYVFPESLQITQKERQVKDLEEETKDYREIFEQISLLGKYENLYLKLQQAETAASAHSETISDLKKLYQNKEEQIKAEEKNLAGLEDFQQQLQQIQSKLRGQEEVKQELTEKSRAALGRAGEARQLVSRAEQLLTLEKEKNEEKRKLASQKAAFEELAQAFGKKGIQAMIIETAIPEIEDEANRLLDRLTEGRMRISLITQKETKTLRPSGSGQAKEHGIVETLDIIISDEMGERPYEAYSGGEQFRVNFAIRLALSKLLTHRAGAKLQFLVIDEGFGTQDAQGRSRIVEALDAIKNDFEKILVITHLEELKEEFPVRIEVNKGPSGSTFEVVGV